MEIWILLLLILLIILLLWLLRRQSRRLQEGKKQHPAADHTPNETSPEKKNRLKICLLCGEDLAPGAPLRTSLYQPDGREGRPMEIHGCPRCAPPPPGRRALNVTPRCPVCKAALKPGEVVFARRFDNSERIQVTILGCRRCYRGLTP